MNKKDLVSILIPCYNHERFVGDCLDSILSQSYAQIEVLICDDASVDQSVKVIEGYKQKFLQRGIRFVMLYHTENCGITVGLNQMLKQVEGEYVKILASDDMLCPDYLRKMTAYLRGNASLQFVYSNCLQVREPASFPVRGEDIIGHLKDVYFGEDKDMFTHIYLKNYIPAPAILFRKSVLDEVGGYDENIGIEDLEMLLRILERYPAAARGYDKDLVYYRVNENSISSSKKNKGAYKRIRFMYRNSITIARKYKRDVSLSVYIRRKRDLWVAYTIQRLNLLLNRY